MKSRVTTALALLFAVLMAGPLLSSPANADATKIHGAFAGVSAPKKSAPKPFVGINIYELANDDGVNEACGPNFAGQWDALLSSFPKGTVVRFWAFEGLATSVTDPAHITWSALDSVFQAAARYHIRLVPVLDNEWATTCPGFSHTDKDLSWYAGGYKSNTDEGPLPYWQWVQAVVARYSKSPALYMWEPINEAQDANTNGTCTESLAEPVLYSFFTEVGGEIHSLDHHHPVESGLLGAGSCGTVFRDYKTIGASPGIDVLSYHDYYRTKLAGGPYNGLPIHLLQAKALHKPIISAEVGIQAGNSCSVSLQRRATNLRNRIHLQGKAGVSGFILWNFVVDPVNCTYDIGLSDPSIRLISGWVTA